MQRQAATAWEACVFTYTFLFRFPLLKKYRLTNTCFRTLRHQKGCLMGQNAKQKTPQRIQSCKESSTKWSSKSEGRRQKRRKVAVLLAKVTVVWGLMAAGCTTLQANLCTSARAKKHHVWVAQKPMMQSSSHKPWHNFEAYPLEKNRMWKHNVGYQSKFS